MVFLKHGNSVISPPSVMSPASLLFAVPVEHNLLDRIQIISILFMHIYWKARAQKNWVPRNWRIMLRWFSSASWRIFSAGSIFQRHSVPTGFVWCLWWDKNTREQWLWARCNVEGREGSKGRYHLGGGREMPRPKRKSNFGVARIAVLRELEGHILGLARCWNVVACHTQ